MLSGALREQLARQLPGAWECAPLSPIVLLIAWQCERRKMSIHRTNRESRRRAGRRNREERQGKGAAFMDTVFRYPLPVTAALNANRHWVPPVKGWWCWNGQLWPRAHTGLFGRSSVLQGREAGAQHAGHSPLLYSNMRGFPACSPDQITCQGFWEPRSGGCRRWQGRLQGAWSPAACCPLCFLYVPKGPLAQAVGPVPRMAG